MRRATKQQLEIQARNRAETAAAFARLLDSNGLAPSVRELGRELGLSSSSTVQQRLRSAVRAGLLIPQPGKARAYRLPGRCPTCGRGGE